MGTSTILGGLIAGVMANRMSIMHTMLASGVIHVALNLVFILQAYGGYNVPMLFLTIGIENMTAGMTSIALVAYVSSLCEIKNTASQYALLSSMTALGRTLLSSSAGYFADLFGWPLYFAFTSAIALPALIILFLLMRNAEASAQRHSLATA